MLLLFHYQMFIEKNEDKEQDTDEMKRRKEQDQRREVEEKY